MSEHEAGNILTFILGMPIEEFESANAHSEVCTYSDPKLVNSKTKSLPVSPTTGMIL